DAGLEPLEGSIRRPMNREQTSLADDSRRDTARLENRNAMECERVRRKDLDRFFEASLESCSVDDGRSLPGLPHREVHGVQRVRRPVEQPRGQSMMLRDREPIPIRGEVRRRMLDRPALPGFDKGSLVSLIRRAPYPRYESPTGIGVAPEDPALLKAR